MRGELFKGVKQWEIEQPGLTLKRPAFYYDNSSLTAVCTAAARKVRKLLPHPDMRLVEMVPGRCLVSFTGFEYRESDIGPYNELSIAFVVTFRKRQIPGVTLWSQMRKGSSTVYVWQLPVTTEVARSRGVEFYGYPKYLADIAFDKGKEWVSCRLAVEGEEILTLAGKVLPTPGGRRQRVVTYSLIDGVPLVANIVTDALEFAASRDRQAAKLTLGSHAISEDLREMELSPNPILYEFSPVTESILFPARNLMDT